MIVATLENRAGSIRIVQLVDLQFDTKNKIICMETANGCASPNLEHYDIIGVQSGTAAYNLFKKIDGKWSRG